MKQLKFKIIRSVIYVFLVFFIYGIMAGGFFRGESQPLLLIPMCTAIALKERAFYSAVFSMFAGFAADMAQGTLPGVSAIWLIPICYLISASASYLVPNIINHLWINAVACTLSLAGTYFFNYTVPGVEGRGVIFEEIIFPSHVYAAVSAPVMFLIIGFCIKITSPKKATKQKDIIEELEEEQ